MIYKSLELLRQNLEDYIHLADPIEDVALENIAMFESLRDDASKAKIIMSLVNVEEEASLKNNPFGRVPKSNGKVDYQNRPVYVNLYILIATNHADYNEALKKLSLVMKFFQSRNRFTVSNSFNRLRPAAGPNLAFTAEEAIEAKLNIELFSLTFEQINHLWGSLGGKQLPFALYVLRILKIEDVDKSGEGSRITTVVINKDKD